MVEAYSIMYYEDEEGARARERDSQSESWRERGQLLCFRMSSGDETRDKRHALAHTHTEREKNIEFILIALNFPYIDSILFT